MEVFRQSQCYNSKQYNNAAWYIWMRDVLVLFVSWLTPQPKWPLSATQFSQHCNVNSPTITVEGKTLPVCHAKREGQSGKGIGHYTQKSHRAGPGWLAIWDDEVLNVHDTPIHKIMHVVQGQVPYKNKKMILRITKEKKNIPNVLNISKM